MSTGTLPGEDTLADDYAIRQVLHLHCRGLDRLDAELLGDCYWPGANVDYGSYKGPADVFADLVVGALAEQYELTRHLLANTLVAIDGDIARVESCVSAAHLLKGSTEEMLFYGRYLDRLERRDDCWKMQHRQVVIDWSKRVAVSDERDSDAFAALARGGHREADPLYAFLADE
jgi:hypothetical protein